MKKPEVEARYRIVIPRVAQIQEAQKLFIDEEKPKKSPILARAAVKSEVEVRRIAQCRQYVPGRGNQEYDECSTEGTYPSPGCSRKELPRQKHVDHPGGDREDDADETLQEQPQP